MSRRSHFTPLLPLALALGLAACSSINKRLEGDKVDYRTSGGKTASLEIPPDLTQLSRDSRYLPAEGPVSASALQLPRATAAVTSAGTATTTAVVAPAAVGSVTLERSGTQRWIASPQSPDQVWPQLQAFWAERGFQLDLEQRETGLMETNWVENRSKLPQDLLRRTLGRLIDNLYDTGERDRYRTRIERTAEGGSEIHVSHRGLVEVYTSANKDNTVWQPRPADPDLEAVMLSRLLAHLGNREAPAKVAAETGAAVTAVTSAAEGAPRARLIGSSPPVGLVVDDGFDRAWRRVGLALDRSGFNVEDRDRNKGLYFVRYTEPPSPRNKDEAGIVNRLLGLFKGKEAPAADPVRYRIAVKGQADTTLVTVLNDQGTPASGAAAERIFDLLVTDLR